MADGFVAKSEFEALNTRFEALTTAVDLDKRNLDIAWIVLCGEYGFNVLMLRIANKRIIIMLADCLPFDSSVPAATLIFFMQAGFAMLEAGQSGCRLGQRMLYVYMCICTRDALGRSHSKTVYVRNRMLAYICP
jgi:hypothetical protein